MDTLAGTEPTNIAWRLNAIVTLLASADRIGRLGPKLVLLKLTLANQTVGGADRISSRVENVRTSTVVEGGPRGDSEALKR